MAWQVGDLALARMPEGDWTKNGSKIKYKGPKPKGIYRVIGMKSSRGRIYLAFHEFDPDNHYDSTCFRKINPDNTGDKIANKEWLNDLLRKKVDV